MEQWYTLHTKPRAEYHVVKELAQRQIYTYLPEELSQTPRGRKPFFPCYLFAKIDFALVSFSSVQWTPGLRRVVAFDDQPVPLADEIIDMIRHSISQMEATGGWLVPSFKPGDTVRIKSGPFQDMLAIFAGPTTPTQRVQVLLNFLGHASRVQVDITDLEEVNPGVEMPPLKRLRGTRGQGRKTKQMISVGLTD
jgi:transcriptional antiterminator RfaH